MNWVFPNTLGGTVIICLQSRRHTEELYRKDLHDPHNHDDVITDLEPDILECEIKWP